MKQQNLPWKMFPYFSQKQSLASFTIAYDNIVRNLKTITFPDFLFTSFICAKWMYTKDLYFQPQKGITMTIRFLIQEVN